MVWFFSHITYLLTYHFSRYFTKVLGNIYLLFIYVFICNMYIVYRSLGFLLVATGQATKGNGNTPNQWRRNSLKIHGQTR